MMIAAVKEGKEMAGTLKADRGVGRNDDEDPDRWTRGEASTVLPLCALSQNHLAPAQ